MKNYNLKINDNEYKVQLDKLDHTSKTARVIVNGNEYIVEVDGVKYVSETEATYSVADMIKEYHGLGILEVTDLYDYLVETGLI